MHMPSKVLYIWKEKTKDSRTKQMIDVISLHFKYTVDHQPNNFTLQRAQDERFVDSRQAIAKAINKKLSKITETEAVELDETKILPNDIFPTDSDTLEEVLYDSQCRTLRIGKEEFELARDVAQLSKLEVKLRPIVGCPMAASCDWRKDCGEDNLVTFHWFTCKTKPHISDQLIHLGSDRSVSLEKCDYVGSGCFFVPQAGHVGKFLVVAAVYGCPSVVKVATVKSPVMQMVEPFIFQELQATHCRKNLPDSRYRVLSYNILANLYLNLDVKTPQEDLFFPYCPRDYQQAEYRYPILLKELTGYNADLMFLQEVDNRMKMRYLEKFLEQNGFTSLFKLKAKAVNEGLMVAYRRDRFQLHGVYDVNLIDLFDSPENADVKAYAEAHPDEAARERIKERPNVLQLIHLQTTSGRHVLAANTHLFFDPRYESIKVIQTLLCLRHIRRVKKQLGDKGISVLFAGDFNSTPDGGSVSLITRGVVGNNHSCWNEDEPTTTFSVGGPEDRLKFRSLCNYPTYTNYTCAEGFRGFAGCLDYIWGTSDIHVDKVLPLPRHELVVKYGAIPSKIAPSDHIPIIAELSFK
ncbi:Endonuclease/Exonuclease/phosphatase family protein [Aphelenchoides avenae]|nr:Endonuclease/Exonuclease/phosphatase family protein [Aphelenchus avenae]